MPTLSDALRDLARLVGASPDAVRAALDAAGLLDPAAGPATRSRPTLAMWSQDDPPPPDPAAPAAVRPTVAPEDWAQRYDDRGPIGMGGMGEVRRVYDRVLRRTLAMKILRESLQHYPHIVARFIEEAEVTAQLQHPGVVPIHDRGVLPDGRLWFTMREVGGRTLEDAIAALHDGEAVGPEDRRRGQRRLVQAIRRACAAVAFAHERGVVHRDLKPSNIMLGPHDDVLVLDWGLARTPRSGEQRDAGDVAAIQTSRNTAQLHPTQIGQVAGTPAYMAPEQARGEVHQIGPWSDVFSLGITLYEALVGETPTHGASPTARGGAPSADETRPMWTSAPADGAPGLDGEAPAAGTPRDGDAALPSGLQAICWRALAQAPRDRFPSAGALGEALQAWLDGAQQRVQATALVAQARDRVPIQQALVEEAQRLARAAGQGLRALPPWAPIDQKAPLWALQDEAAAASRRANLASHEQEMLLHSALTRVPDLPDAHAALARHYAAVHQELERTRRDPARVEAQLRRHTGALPPQHPDRAGLRAYLDGRGLLTLHTDPPGATVTIHRLEEVQRRLVPTEGRSLGATPLDAVELPAGSYLCELRHPDRATATYPVHIGRQAHWDGRPPGETQPYPVPLLRADRVPPAARYVPAGPMLPGGHGGVPDDLAATPVWVEGFFIQETPVTNADYLAFINDPAVDGDRWAPRERPNPRGEPGSLLVARTASGRFELTIDPDGDEWTPDMPAVYVDLAAARAYAAWLSAQTNRRWRLPTELEWRKACQGVDGRPYPWGYEPEPTWAQCLLSGPGRQILTDVKTFPEDRSPYGVHDLAGNCQEWTADTELDVRARIRGGRALPPPAGVGPVHIVCGGQWNRPLERHTRRAPKSQPPLGRAGGLGFRLVCALEEPAP